MSAIDFERELFLPLLDGVIGSSGVGVSVLDEDLRYVFTNTVAGRLHGAPAETVIGRTVAEVLPELAATVVPALRRVLDEGTPVERTEVEGRAPGTGGQVGHWLASYFPVEVNGRRYVAAVSLDITDRVADRARLEAMAELSGALNGALRMDDVAQIIVEHGPAVVEADFANIGLLTRDGAQVQMVLPPVIDVIRERWSTVTLDGPRTPFHVVFETGLPVYVDHTNRAELFPHLVDEAERAGLDSVVALPLVDADGTVFGSLALGWNHYVAHTDESRARLAVLADLCSQALQRVRTGEARDDLVSDLQQEILAPWETPRTLEVGVAYRPANDELGFGGDWYDVIILDGRAVFVVGDVAGHGSPAAARMTATKATIRAFVTTFDAEEVIPRVNEALHHLQSGYVATAALAWIDKREHTLTWCLAGHPPGVLRAPDGTTTLLEGVHHPPIGMRLDPRPLPTVPFPAGSQLVLYTDGLIERRDEDLDVRLEALRAEVASLPATMPVTEVCDHLIDALSDAHDDVAVIVIRQPPLPG